MSEISANQANWDERVASHLIAYDVEGFIADSARISDVVREDHALMAPLLPSGPFSLVHLQCHIGLDTLSWARLGAEVTGIDFSDEAIDAARDIAYRAGLSADFIAGEIDPGASAQQYDVVYTGTGALPWLPDLKRWATTIAALLKPGGLFFVRDAHPMLNAIDDERSDGVLAIGLPYFASGSPLRYDHGTTYADDSVRLENDVTYEWPHSLGEIVQSLLDAGLKITSLAEHRTIPWRALKQMVGVPGGWALPGDDARLPLTFSLTATS